MNEEKLLYEKRISQLEVELQKAIYKKNQYKKEQEEFFHLASHDLQAPLRKLSTFVEKLTYKLKDLRQQEANFYIERIQSTLVVMREIIDNLSVISDSIKSDPGFGKCDLNELLQNILEESESAITENDLAVICSPMPVIEGNYAQLKELFQNLITNSIKFRKKDSPLQIEITAGPIDEEDKKAFDLDNNTLYHKIEIMDNGIGFDGQHSQKIFKPFVRLHGNSDYEGHGLGLALCKKIIEKHHGFIFAKSARDSGTRFILILPAAHI